MVLSLWNFKYSLKSLHAFCLFETHFHKTFQLIEKFLKSFQVFRFRFVSFLLNVEVFVKLISSMQSVNKHMKRAIKRPITVYDQKAGKCATNKCIRIFRSNETIRQFQLHYSILRQTIMKTQILCDFAI